MREQITPVINPFCFAPTRAVSNTYFHTVRTKALKANPLLKCASCGSIVQEGSSRCGLCGGIRFSSMEQLSQREVIGRTVPPKSGHGKAVAAIGSGFAILALGSAFALLPISPVLTVIGFFMMMMGAVLLMGMAGIFRSALYHGRTARGMNKVERDREGRERKKTSD